MSTAPSVDPVILQRDAALASMLTCLLGFLGGFGSVPREAHHLAAAIGTYRSAKRLETEDVGQTMRALQRVAARVARGPRRSVEDQRGAEVGDSAPAGDGGPMPDTLLTRLQAAKRMGCHVSTLKRREQQGLKVVRHGRVVRYRVADIDEFLHQNRTP